MGKKTAVVEIEIKNANQARRLARAQRMLNVAEESAVTGTEILLGYGDEGTSSISVERVESGQCCRDAQNVQGSNCKHGFLLKLLRGEMAKFETEVLEQLYGAELKVWEEGGYRGDNAASPEVRKAVGLLVAQATGRTFIDYFDRPAWARGSRRGVQAKM